LEFDSAAARSRSSWWWIGIPSSREEEEPSASLDHKTPSYRPPPKVPKCFASFHLTER